MFRSFLVVTLLLSSHAFAATGSYVVKIDGMTCAPCAETVARALQKLPLVDRDSVVVTLSKNEAVLKTSKLGPETIAQIKQAIEKAGYTVESVVSGK